MLSIRTLTRFFKYFTLLGGMGKKRGGYLLIWHAVIWPIWKAQNDDIFKGVTPTIKEVLDKSVFQSLNWFLGRMEKNSYTITE